MPTYILTSRGLIDRRRALLAEQEAILARLRDAESALRKAQTELNDLAPFRNSVVHSRAGEGKTSVLARYVAQERALANIQDSVQYLSGEYAAITHALQKLDSEIRDGIPIPVPDHATGDLALADRKWIARRQSARRAERRALAALDRFSTLVPNAKLCSEEIGDAGEWIERCADAGWSPIWIYIKMLTTMFGLVVNAWREKGKR